jgi:hypothetical protein
MGYSVITNSFWVWQNAYPKLTELSCNSSFVGCAPMKG